MSFLINVGQIPPGNIETQGYGENKLLASNTTKQGRTKNRRVTALIINE